MLVLDKLSKSYAGALSRSVLRDVDLAVARGECLFLVGLLLLLDLALLRRSTLKNPLLPA